MTAEITAPNSPANMPQAAPTAITAASADALRSRDERCRLFVGVRKDRTAGRITVALHRRRLSGIPLSVAIGVVDRDRDITDVWCRAIGVAARYVATRLLSYAAIVRRVPPVVRIAVANTLDDDVARPVGSHRQSAASGAIARILTQRCRTTHNPRRWHRWGGTRIAAICRRPDARAVRGCGVRIVRADPEAANP